MDNRLFIIICITMVLLAVLGYFIGRNDGYSDAMTYYVQILREFAESMNEWVQKNEEDEGT